MNKNDIKNLVNSQLPQHVKEYSPLFVDFMISYYEWLGGNDGPFLRSSNEILPKIVDIDNTLDDFILAFKEKFLKDFPVELLLNTQNGNKLNSKNVIKNIKRFYSSKGTEKSYRFLFRILFNSEIDFYYPKQDILKLSDGKWSTESLIRMDNNSKYDSLVFNEARLFQTSIEYDSSSDVTGKARIVYSQKTIKFGKSIREFKISGVVGEFKSNYNTFIRLPDGRVISYSRIRKILQGVKINSKGTGYKIGDELTFTQKQFSVIKGVLPKASVSRISSFGGNFGQIEEIRIEDPGFLIDDIEFGSVQIVGSPGSSGFSGEMQVGAIFSKNQKYENNDGKISSNKFIQDNRFYQDYSYVIKSEKTLESYLNLIKELIHPAGFLAFNQILISRCVRDNPSIFINIIKKEERRIGNYAPYTFRTYDDLSPWFGDNCYSPTAHDIVIQHPTNIGNPVSAGFGFGPTNNGCLDDGITSGDFDSSSLGYWRVYSHPNTYLNNTTLDQALVNIYVDQLTDFYGRNVAGTGQSLTGWQEWNISIWNNGPTSQQIDFFNSLNSSTGPALVPLINYAQGKSPYPTEFRKISIGEFLETVSFSYDCRYFTQSSEIGASGPPNLIEINNKTNDEIALITSEISPSKLYYRDSLTQTNI